MAAFTIVSDVSNANKKYKMGSRSVCFKLNDIPEDVVDPEAFVKNGIKSIVAHIVQEVEDEDKVGFTFSSDGFGKGDAYLSFKKAKNVTFEQVWDLLGKIYQSNSEGFHSDTFRMTMTCIKPSRGRGRPRARNYNNFEEECAKRRGIVAISNDDSNCLPRALVVGMAYALKSPNIEKIRRNYGKIQDIEMVKLLEESGVEIPENGASIEEIRKLQVHLSDFKITVYAYNTKGRTVLFEGPDAPLKINLLHHENHFNVITNLKACFCSIYYCEICHLGYDHKAKHKCQASCPCCQQTPVCEKTRQEITCGDCNRKFRGPTCYNNHKTSLAGSSSSKDKQSICQQIKRCPDCLKTIQASREHTCGEIFCQVCEKHQPAGHLCYIQPNDRNPPKKDFLFIFYDLESRQDEENERGEKIHVPNLCVFQQRCDVCIDQGNDVSICTKCIVRQQVLERAPIETFLGFVLGVRKAHKKVVVMAHNGQGYDHQFLLKHVIENTDLNVELIMRGTKILMMKIDNVKFIDSINYFPMALSALPKAFDLGPELKKGHFPHLMNTLANAKYDGLLPPLEYYNPDSLAEEARLELIEWHREHQNDKFNLWQDLIDYCISDVDILTKACLKFRKMFLAECNVCPFLEAVTIASACNLVYRRNFLQPETIGLIPRNGYRCVDRQSKIATLWLIYEEAQRGISIRHSIKEKEAIVEGVKVDGYIEATKTVFEFQGCYYHGHTCLTHNRDSPLRDDYMDTLNIRLERTQKKINRLRERGYEVVEMWQCQFEELLEKNNGLRQELESNPLLASTPLDPRDAFYGGRTGNCKTFYQVKPGEKIKYVDVCSLYPYVCKYGKFPIGHPEVHLGDVNCQKLIKSQPEGLKNINGLIKCKILPPQDLFHPVLPQKMNERLMFVLCRTCGKELNIEGGCDHSEDERALIGTWVVDEVVKALEMGYQMLEIFEIWEYQIEQYDRFKRTGGLFSDMMNKFIQVKQQASGWPGDCVTEDQKNSYVEEFLSEEGIRLEFDKILNNPGLRSLAKLMLNSFWGKFGQRENQPKTTIVRQPSELDELLYNSAIDVNHVEDINGETLVVSWQHKDEAADILSTVNVCIAAYTTAQARLKLYSYLELLGNRVLYYDTDSVIYISRKGEPDLPTGNSIGSLTDELQSYSADNNDAYIVAFTSGGPKVYSFIIFSPKYHTYFLTTKVKGIRLNFNNLKTINFYSMTRMVTAQEELVEEQSAPLYITSMNIRRTKRHQVVTKAETKIFRPRSEKRKFDDDFSSVPFGYKRRKSSSSSC